MRGLKISSIVCFASVFFGCTAETFETAEDANEVGETSQAVWMKWNDGGYGSGTVGLAYHNDFGFQWRSNGKVCKGPYKNPCSGTVHNYSAPRSFEKILGIGIAKNTGWVYTWYSDGTYSRGSFENLSEHDSNGNLDFTRPFKPGSTTDRFLMSSLVEADNSDNGEWYFYWKTDNKIFRTTGPSNNGDGYSKAKQATVLADTNILGIMFGQVSPAVIGTYYANGKLNVSSNSLILTKED